MRRVFIFMFLVLLLLPLVNAQKGQMKLLAVSDTENGQVGGIADLFLEIKPGSGKVFLETFPLTRVDTQISTRLAKEIACDFAEADCNNLDFFYTITADSSIIAGPSAGAAISVLTFSLLKGIPIDEKTAITGTINSGGLIGPVGGLKAKIEAASKERLRKVLIPIGESIDGMSNITQESNNSIIIEELKKRTKVEIIEVPTLDDAVFHFTGKKFREKKADLEISDEYSDTMKLLAIQLCSRSSMLDEELKNAEIADNNTERIKEGAINLSAKGEDAFRQSRYYSAASYCFGSNVEFNYLSLLDENPDEEEIFSRVKKLKEEAKNFEREIESKRISTITQLESYMVVKERLVEANDFLTLTLEAMNDKNSSLRNLAYAEERISSARSWAKFMDGKGKEFDLNTDVVKNACRTKIAEVEERLQYVQLTLSQNLDATKKELDYAYHDLENQDYELCLFKASKAKANVDTVLSVLGVRTGNVNNIVSQKLGIVERNLIEETEKGVFPILGYSYYEYANSLKDNDPFSALLYSGYALELSSLDIYFKDAEIRVPIEDFSNKIDTKLLAVLVLGILIGIVISNIHYLKSSKARKGK